MRYRVKSALRSDSAAGSGSVSTLDQASTPTQTPAASPSRWSVVRLPPRGRTLRPLAIPPAGGRPLLLRPGLRPQARVRAARPQPPVRRPPAGRRRHRRPVTATGSSHDRRHRPCWSPATTCCSTTCSGSRRRPASRSTSPTTPGRAARLGPRPAVVLVGADLADGLGRAPAAPPRPGARRRARPLSGDAVFRSRARGRRRATWSSCRPRTPGWSSCSPTRPTAGARLGRRTVGVVAGSGGAGATTFAARPGADLRARRSHRRCVDLDPLGPGPGPGRRARRRHDRACRWDALVASAAGSGSRSLRAALPGQDGLAVLTWGAGPPRRARRRRGARGAVGGPARPRRGGRRPAPRAVDDAGRRRWSPGATGCSSWPRRRSPGWRPPAGSPPRCGRSTDRLGRGRPRRRRRRSRRTRSPPRWACRSSPRCPHQRRLVEHVDLGLGPVHARRSPLARAARGALGLRRPRVPREAAAPDRRRCRPDVARRRARAAGPQRCRRSPPTVVARALRDQGRPVGDATVLAVHDLLRQDVLGAGPLEPLLRLPGSPTCSSTAPDAVYVDRGDGLELTGDPVRRRRRGAPARAAAGRVGRAPARRRDAVRRPAAARRHPLPRRARAAGPAGHGDLAARAAGAGCSPSTSSSSAAPSTPTRRSLLRRLVAPPARVPGQRRHRLGQDDPALRAAVAGRPRSPHRGRRGRQRAAARPPARRRAGVPARQRRGRRRGADAGAGPAGAADAARPAGRRRGPRRRGHRPARRDEHRPRGRLRHRARQLGGRRARPHRGARDGGRDAAGRGAQPAGVGRRRRRAPGPRARTGAAGSPRSRCCSRGPTGGWWRCRP